MAERYSIIRQTVTIKATPEEVYDALMDSKKHSVFTGSPASISPKVGAKFSSWDGYIFGKNLELVRGKKISQEWTTTEWPEGYPPSRLEIALTKKSNGTRVRMVHSRVPAEQAKDYAEGWRSYYWEPLNAYFEKKH